MGRDISIRGEHASVRTLSAIQQAKRFGKATTSKLQLAKQVIATKMKEGTLVRRKHIKKGYYVPASYSAAMSLANLLFPKNFPQIVATGLKTKTQKHSNVTYTKFIPLTKESQKGIESFYDDVLNKKFRMFFNFEKTKYNKYPKKVNPKIAEISKRIGESGIVLNDYPMNVGVRRAIGNEFIFFEVGAVDLKKLHRYIRKLPQATEKQKLTKSQAWALFEFLKTQPVESDGLIHTHARSK